jgi:hypothetical protein
MVSLMACHDRFTLAWFILLSAALAQYPDASFHSHAPGDMNRTEYVVPCSALSRRLHHLEPIVLKAVFRGRVPNAGMWAKEPVI